MQITAAELSELLNGTVEGDSSVVVKTVAKIEDGRAGALSFLANSKYEEYVYNTLSTIVLVNRSFKPSKKITATLIKVDDAYASFSLILAKFSDTAVKLEGIEDFVFIDPSAKLGEHIFIGSAAYLSADVSIGDHTKIYPHVFIGKNVNIGKNCIIYPGVKIYYDCQIGNNCIIHAGAVIGADGFGFAPLPDRSYRKIPQTGNVIIEDNVEIGANTTIDRATMGSTIIRTGAKIDNLVQIGHNAEIGEHCVIAGQAGVSGSAKLGKYCVLGGQVAIAGHLVIADGSQFGGQSGTLASITEPNKKWFGSPISELRETLKMITVQRRLPELLTRIEALEKELLILKKQ